MKINVDKPSVKAIICLENGCKFKKSCANHSSAGDFRTESGFSPELEVVNGEIYCQTYDRNALKYGKFTIVYPENLNNLEYGCVCWKNVIQELDYQI